MNRTCLCALFLSFLLSIETAFAQQNYQAASSLSGIPIVQDGLGIHQVGFDYLVERGDAAPGTNAFFGFGVDPDYGVFDSVHYNGLNAVAFRGFLSGMDINAGNDHGVFLATLGSVQLYLRAGEAAPGAAGSLIQRAFPQAVNGNGQMLIQAVQQLITVPPGGDDTSTVLYYGTPGHLVTTNLPGSIPNSIALNSNNQVAYDVGGNGVRTIYAGGLSSPQKLIAIGDAAPGLPEGYHFSNVFNAIIDASGRVAFQGTVEGPIGALPQNGIWATNDLGNLQLVELGNELTADGIPETYSNIELIRDRSDTDSLAFRAIRDSDHQEQLFTIVPEPALATLMVPGAMLFLRRRRDR